MTTTLSVQSNLPLPAYSFPPNQEKTPPPIAKKIFQITTDAQNIWKFINDSKKISKQIFKTIINGYRQSAPYLSPVIDSINILSIITIAFIPVSVCKAIGCCIDIFLIQDIEGCCLALLILSKKIASKICLALKVTKGISSLLKITKVTLLSTLTTWIGFSLSLVGALVKTWKIAHKIGLFFAIKKERHNLVCTHTNKQAQLENLNSFLKNTLDISEPEWKKLCQKIRSKNQHKTPKEIERTIQLANQRLVYKKAHKLQRKVGAPMYKQLNDLYRTLDTTPELTETHYTLAKETLDKANKVSNRKMAIDTLILSVSALSLVSFCLFTMAPLAPLVPFIFLTLAGLIKSTVKATVHIFEDRILKI